MKLTSVVGLCLALMALVAACRGPSPTQDSTPPGFIQVTVAVQHVLNGYTEPPIEATQGLTLNSVHRDTRIVVVATVGDQQSGVSSVTLIGEAVWDCTSPDGKTAQNKHLTFAVQSDEAQNGTAGAGNPILRSAHFTRDPLEGNPLRLVRPAADDASALTMTLTPQATNGAGLPASAPDIVIT